jgi:hypothetical protein
MGFLKKHPPAGHEEKMPNHCGTDFPTSSNVGGGTDVSGSNRRCGGGFDIRETKDNEEAERKSNTSNARVANKQVFNVAIIQQGGKIKAADIDNLLSKIKVELSSPGRGGYSGLPNKISGDILKSDFQAMANSVANEAGTSPVNFNSRDGIYSADVQSLINQYNALTNDCICNSDCGTNKTCTCHNDCGCHY